MAEADPPPTNSRLHRFCIVTAATTLCLLGLGGLVTSHGVGMAVPDWPNTYGYNMFFFPISKWVGGIFYEHTHRLLASAVGLLTAILAVWLQGRGARPFLRYLGLVCLVLGIITAVALPQHWPDGVVSGGVGCAALMASWFWPCCEPSPKWLRRLGLAAFLAVVLQGILGGLRVVLFKDQIGIFHAVLGQLFFALLCALALFTSPWWCKTQSLEPKARFSSRRLCYLFGGAFLLIFCQLILGASMRHQHAGLSIPDFPLAYGKIWPAMDPASIALYNQRRLEIVAQNPITAVQILLQLAHRLVALLVVAVVGLCAWQAQREFGPKHLITKIARGWLGLILSQVLLGAATIWSNKAADIATAHMVVGALSLAWGVVGTSILVRFSRFELVPDPSGSPGVAAVAARLQPRSAA